MVNLRHFVCFNTNVCLTYLSTPPPIRPFCLPSCCYIIDTWRRRAQQFLDHHHDGWSRNQELLMTVSHSKSKNLKKNNKCLYNVTTARQRRLFERSVLQCFMTHLNVTLGGKKKKQRLNSRRACCHRSLNSPSSSLQPTFFTMHLPAQPLHGDTNSITLPRNPFPWVGGPNYLSSATSPKCPEWLLHDSSG